MKKLLETTKIGSMTLKNRFISAAIGDFIEGGHVNEEIIEKYETLAKGGVGTIITGFTLIDEAEKLFPILSIYEDSFTEDLKKLTDRVHSYGVNFISQLVYIGSYVIGAVGERNVLGPSAVANLNTNVIPKEMTIDEIKAVQQKFVEAALRAKKSGFDGIEIHAAHGFLLNQFITPYYNSRNDIYGGSIENRARMIIETYSAIREAVGTKYPILVKVNSMEGFDGGLTLDDYIYVCRELARLGADAIEVSGDWMSLPSNKGVYFEKEAMAIAEENNIAVIVTGGNRNFEQMEQLLNSTNIGYFGMARPFISEPDLVNKYEKEHITKIRCISCNKCADPSTGCKCIFDR